MLGALSKLLPLAPLLFAGAGGLAAGSAVGWFGRGLVEDNFVKPILVRSVEQRERDACTIRTQDAARRAEEATELMWRAISAEALAAEEADDAIREAARVRQIDALNEEIEANEKRLAAEGRSCPLDDATERWLRDQWGLPPRS